MSTSATITTIDAHDAGKTGTNPMLSGAPAQARIAKPRIGITERGDASLDYAWTEHLDAVDGAILITKHITKRFIDEVLAANERRPIIVHATVTGWGASAVEPNVCPPDEAVSALARLVMAGFPCERCVLRIDPIIPTAPGLACVRRVLALARTHACLANIRVRVSVLDEYAHVKKRLHDAGYASFYEGRRFRASAEEFRAVAALLEDEHREHGHMFETCAEPDLRATGVIASGCVSDTDMDLMGLHVADAGIGANPQNRFGCLCSAAKTELLGCRGRCAHNCLYCYWKDDARK